MRLILRWTRRVLLVCAVSLLAWCGFVLIDARMFRKEEDRQLSLSPSVVSPIAAISHVVATPGLIGRIDIPRLALSVIVMEGTSSKTLRRAAGHIAGTALPGQPGNVGISGHRDTFFRPLRNIEANDTITVTTTAGEYRYRVLSTRIVEPDDVAVLDPGDDPVHNETLTLVTCYPFYFVGPAPKRFIVRAQRVG
jgi:sortase A